MQNIYNNQVDFSKEKAETFEDSLNKTGHSKLE